MGNISDEIRFRIRPAGADQRTHTVFITPEDGELVGQAFDRAMAKTKIQGYLMDGFTQEGKMLLSTEPAKNFVDQTIHMFDQERDQDRVEYFRNYQKWTKNLDGLLPTTTSEPKKS